jgi:hypothetical protein
VYFALLRLRDEGIFGTDIELVNTGSLACQGTTNLTGVEYQEVL